MYKYFFQKKYFLFAHAQEFNYDDGVASGKALVSGANGDKEECAYVKGVKQVSKQKNFSIVKKFPGFSTLSIHLLSIWYGAVKKLCLFFYLSYIGPGHLPLEGRPPRGL